MNQNLTTLLTTISNLLKVAGALLAAHGLADSGLAEGLEIGSGAVMVIGPAIYDVYQAALNMRRAAAVGVQAGVNMTVAGKALASDGVSVVRANDGTTPPLPVTVATAKQIVADFGPAAPPAAK